VLIVLSVVKAVAKLAIARSFLFTALCDNHPCSIVLSISLTSFSGNLVSLSAFKRLLILVIVASARNFFHQVRKFTFSPSKVGSLPP
jgi:hypothetical protein